MASLIIQCLFCKKDFSAKKKEINRGRKFCSRDCSSKSHDKGIHHKPRAKKESTVVFKFYQAQKRSVRIGVECASQDDFLRWYLTSERVCVYCGIPEETWKKFYMGVHNKPGLTIDRKDSSLGYVPNNMALCCAHCNAVKSNVLNYEEMKTVGDMFIKPKWQGKLKLQEQGEVISGRR